MTDIKTIKSWLEGLAEPDWRMYHSDSEVQTIAQETLALLKEQEERTGRWVLDDDDTNTWECSECGSLQIIIDGTPFDNSWFYCPRCGCKMERQVSRDGKTDF